MKAELTASDDQKPFAFSLRTQFIVISLLCLGVALIARARQMESSAQGHEREWQIARENWAARGIDWKNHPPNAIYPPALPEIDGRRESYQVLYRWHRDMAAKYREAKWRPWERVVADSPEPPDPEPHLPNVRDFPQ